jgi:hypothetical protein
MGWREARSLAPYRETILKLSPTTSLTQCRPVISWFSPLGVPEKEMFRYAACGWLRSLRFLSPFTGPLSEARMAGREPGKPLSALWKYSGETASSLCFPDQIGLGSRLVILLRFTRARTHSLFLTLSLASLFGLSLHTADVDARLSLSLEIKKEPRLEFRTEEESNSQKNLPSCLHLFKAFNLTLQVRKEAT